MIPTRIAIALAVGPWLLLAPVLVHAEAFRIPNQGPAATAQASAVAAQADDPSALFYNPAGMTQLPGTQVYFGGDLISVDTKFTGAAGTVRGGTGGVANPPPSFFYLTSSLRDLGLTGAPDVTLGFGLNAPFGLLIRYPDEGSLSEVTTYASLPLLDIKPTIAYRPASWLSLGAGLDIFTFSDLVGEGQAEQKRRAGPELGPLGIPRGAFLEINGTDTAVGFNLSALVTALRTDGKPRLNFGIVYRGPVTLNLKGDFLLNGRRAAGAEVEFKLPSILTGAVAAWPLRDAEREWKVELDVDYADWSSFKSLDFKLSNGVTLPLPQNWRSTYVVKLGTEYRWLNPSGLAGWEIAARGGYSRNGTPVPTRTFGPAVPDSGTNVFGIGVGFLCKGPGRFLGMVSCGDRESRLKAFGVDIAYQAVVFDSRRIDENIDPRVLGKWSTISHVGAIAFRLNF